MSYKKWNLLKILANHAYHSPEMNETEDEDSNNVYDLFWRSEELRLLLRNIQYYDRVLLDDAPDWSFIEQPDMVYDTEYTVDDDNLNFDNDELNAILVNK
ncbi:hypothetical protein C1646_764043 [Rhizophagus diaphanus]|nr:hypothetical protein C1646_764043 [Rhizophagus diaphanus] [Rhizophagus sp. MUCL 43196]